MNRFFYLWLMQYWWTTFSFIGRLIVQSNVFEAGIKRCVIGFTVVHLCWVSLNYFFEGVQFFIKLQALTLLICRNFLKTMKSFTGMFWKFNFRYRTAHKIDFHINIQGFIKTTDNWPNDQPTTYPPTHRPLKHAPTDWLSSIYVKIKTRLYS